MLRIERVDRRSFFDGMTPGWVLGAVGYAASIATLFFFSNRVGFDTTPCLLKQSTGVPCPLCGGTRASVSLLTGHPLTAFAMNPGVAVALPCIAVWLFLRIGFGIAPRITLPQPVLYSVVSALVLVNWAYTIYAHQSI